MTSHRPIIPLSSSNFTPTREDEYLDSSYDSDGSDTGLSLADFLTQEDAQSHSSLSTIRPSTALGAHVDSVRAEDISLTRAESVANRRDSFDRRLNESDLDWRTRAVHSPVARQVITEVSEDLKQTHDALMECLYATESAGGEENGKEVGEGYQWKPSLEQLQEVYESTESPQDAEEAGDDDVKKSLSERTIVRLRGGGMQEFFGLKRGPREYSTQPQRPQIIRRPSDAFSRVVGRGSVGTTVGPSAAHSELIQNSPPRAQDPRLRRLQQSDMLKPPSFISNVGSNATAGYGRTASIVPEGSVASYNMGFQTRPGTLYKHADADEPRASISDFPKVPPPPVSGGRSKRLLKKPSLALPDQSAYAAHGVSSPVELPTNDTNEQWSSGNRLAPSPEPEPEHAEELGPVPKLRSPMQSPVKSSWRNFSRPPGSPNTVSASEAQGSGYNKEPQNTFFVPQRHGNLEHSTVGSLRKNRRLLGQSQVSVSSLSLVEEHYAESNRLTQGTPLQPDPDLSLEDSAEPWTMGADRSHRSIWYGGDHLSIVPGDSASEVGVGNAPQARQPAPKSRKAKLLPGGTLAELEEREDFEEPRAKERSEDRFQEEIRRVWTSYQTRIRLIHEDVMKTEEEKKAAVKDEQRYLELLIGQASNETGFAQLHEPWQKDQFVRNLFGVQPKPSRTPSIFRKANKVMKWVLAVPDDPELKTHSSRKQSFQYSKLDAAPSNLQRDPTNTTTPQPGSSRSQPTPLVAQNQYRRLKQEDVPFSPDEHRRFHFAPTPPVHAAVRNDRLWAVNCVKRDGMADTVASRRRHEQMRQSRLEFGIRV
ncbi:hypothetical protein BU23DRAFT_640909 [Bimuria novae-zelandiae CBS 107.79]|uniref:Uncharacterized protein n=1 Tax=Bimuria novae-zelandiae CBS 107.79 TaxID=1447943 RepID=A0A6A5VIL0_9PLEO|nr:hypothetical protein BU23DRAFT_640909 [Bimuria novae-zelandiae CBS 107.79]